MYCILMLLTLNMLFLFLNHPMSMGLLMIMQTLAISIISGVSIKTFWVSYMLLITMLSGMLVLFIYMSTVASNEKFKTKISLWIMTLSLLLVYMMYMIYSNKLVTKSNYLNSEMFLTKTPEMLYFTKMFKTQNMMITIMMVLYLLMTMIVSTSLINISEGPMRLKM